MIYGQVHRFLPVTLNHSAVLTPALWIFLPNLRRLIPQALKKPGIKSNNQFIPSSGFIK
jgi:hypothetical protein